MTSILVCSCILNTVKMCCKISHLTKTLSFLGMEKSDDFGNSRRQEGLQSSHGKVAKLATLLPFSQHGFVERNPLGCS